MIIYLPSQWRKVAEMSLSYNLLLWLFMKYSSPALIQTEQRGHDQKKIYQNLLQIKTCRPYLFQMTCSADRP